jgi:hypothetical protein
MNVEVNPDEDTEWNDILRQHGVIPEKPPSPTQQLEEAFEEALEKAHENRLEGKSLDELDELEEDGLEDEAFIEQYKQKRMAEIREQASKERYGEVVKISKPDYTDEITNESKNATVVVHLSYPGVTQSKLLAALFGRLSPKFKDVKFVEIDARQVNENYPLQNCPTILVYRDTNVVKQYITLDTLGGNSANLKDMEQMLVTVEAVKESDPRLIINQEEEDRYRGKSSLRSGRYNDDSDSDFD